jgi:hypothetical protein
MTTKTRLATGIVCVLLAGATSPGFLPGVRSQSASLPSRIVAVGGAGLPGIDVAPYDPVMHPAFADLFERPGWSQTGQFAVVVTNNSNHDIDSVVIRWALADADHGVRWRTFQNDRYRKRDRGAVIEAGHSAIVTPSGLIPDTLAGKRFMTSALLAPPLLQTLAAQAPVTVQFDSAILDDGRVLGWDDFRIVDYLQARHQAARALADDIALTAGTADDVALVARRHMTDAPAAGDQRGRWLGMLASDLARSPGNAARVADMPNLPAFSR